MLPRKCGYCGRPLSQDQATYCSTRCQANGARLKANLRKIEQGRVCKHCGKALPKDRVSYCGKPCQSAHMTKEHRCPICGARWQGGVAGPCSDKCAREQKRRNKVKLEDARWLAARFDQPSLVTAPQKVWLWRRPLHTNSGRPVAMCCWKSASTAEFPTDPETKYVFWKEGKYAFAQGRHSAQTRKALLALTAKELEVLHEVVDHTSAKRGTS